MGQEAGVVVTAKASKNKRSARHKHLQADGGVGVFEQCVLLVNLARDRGTVHSRIALSKDEEGRGALLGEDVKETLKKRCEIVRKALLGPRKPVLASEGEAGCAW